MRLAPLALPVSLLLAALGAAACSGGGTDAPIIENLDIPLTVDVGDTVAVSVTARDPGGLDMTYEWTCSEGTISAPTSATCNWTAPAAPGAVVLSVRVTNTADASAIGTRGVSVVDPASSVSGEVRAIITQKCVSCHVERPASHTGARDIEQCGACHVPYGNTTQVNHTASTTGCVTCHPTPAVTHFFLRDDNDQTVFEAGAEAQCIACHRDGGHDTHGRGRPALDDDTAILASARRGTLRAWIQPGGFMAKYLDPAEVATLTAWVDLVSAGRTLGYDPYLVAAPTSDFTITGLGDESEWAAATEHVVDLEPTIYTAANLVRMKALYSTTKLYVRVEYDDSTLSMTRSGSWILDAGAWRHPVAASDNDKQSEDRVAFLWDQTIPDFRDRYGCAVKCHGNVPGSACFTDQAGAKGDIWHTKAARAMGVTSQTDSGALTVDFASEAFEVTAGQAAFTGWSDDKWLTSYMNLADGYDTEDSGRRGDAGSSMYGHNRNAAKTAPKYMETNPTAWSDAMVLTQVEVDAGLLDGSVLVADPDDPGYDALAAANAWAQYDALHAVVPERILRVPAGSRGDLVFAASWDDGTWVNEFVRPLLTTNSDDVQFETSGATEYPFGLAIFDNCGRGEIPPGHTTYGDGQYQVLRFQ